MQETITADQFRQKVIEGTGISVVKFGVDGCPPCVAYDVQIGDLIREFGGRVAFLKVDFEDDRNNATEAARVMKRFAGRMPGYPHIIVVKDGAITGEIHGFSIAVIRSQIMRVLSQIA